MWQSTTSTNLLRIIPYTGAGSHNPTTQNGDTLLVIRNVNDTGKILNIIPRSSPSSGLQIDGVNSTLCGSLTVTNNM